MDSKPIAFTRSNRKEVESNGQLYFRRLFPLVVSSERLRIWIIAAFPGTEFTSSIGPTSNVPRALLKFALQTPMKTQEATALCYKTYTAEK